MCTFSALTLKSGIFSTAFLKSSSFSILRCLNNGLFTGHELSKTYFTLCMSRIEGGGFFLLRISSSWYLGASSSLLIMKRKFLAPSNYCLCNVSEIDDTSLKERLASDWAGGIFILTRNIIPAPACGATNWSNLATVGKSQDWDWDDNKTRRVVNSNKQRQKQIKKRKEKGPFGHYWCLFR